MRQDKGRTPTEGGGSRLPHTPLVLPRKEGASGGGEGEGEGEGSGRGDGYQDKGDHPRTRKLLSLFLHPSLPPLTTVVEGGTKGGLTGIE